MKRRYLWAAPVGGCQAPTVCYCIITDGSVGHADYRKKKKHTQPYGRKNTKQAKNATTEPTSHDDDTEAQIQIKIGKEGGWRPIGDELCPCDLKPRDFKLSVVAAISSWRGGGGVARWTPPRCLQLIVGNECSQTALWDVSDDSDSRRFGHHLPMIVVTCDYGSGRPLRRLRVSDSSATSKPAVRCSGRPLHHPPLSSDSGARLHKRLCGWPDGSGEPSRDWGTSGRCAADGSANLPDGSGGRSPTIRVKASPHGSDASQQAAIA